MVKLLPKWNTVSQAQQKKGQKIALFDQIKLKNEPKNQFQSVFFLHEKLGLLSFSKEQKSLGY